MEIEINDGAKLLIVWLAKNEEKEFAQSVIDQYRGNSYKVAVFRSGKVDLVVNTAALLRYNKQCLAKETSAI